VGKIEDIDYVQFCGGPRPDWETLGLNPSSNTASRITANVGSVSGLVPRPLLLSWQAKLMIILRDDVQDLRGIMESKKRPVRILDVRPKTEFGICHLPSSTRTFIAPTLIRVSNTLAHQSTDVPLHNLVANPGDYVSPEIETYVVCRLGNDSQIAAEALRSARPDPTFVIKDLVGGLGAWSRDVDPGFPVY